MAPPPSNGAVSPLVALVVRILTFACLVISLIIITTNTLTVTITGTSDYSAETKIKFSDFYAYRYLVATVVFGLAYTLLQTAFNIYLVSTGNRIAGDGLCLFDFYGDKIISYFLATGAAASFGMTQDLKQLQDGGGVDKFLNRANAAASLCLLAFVFAAVSSTFSAFALPKRST